MPKSARKRRPPARPTPSTLPATAVRIEVSGFVADYIDQLRSQPKKTRPTWRDLAERFGTHAPTVINLHAHGKLCNTVVEAAVARELFRGSLDRLHQAAHAFWMSDKADRWRDKYGLPVDLDDRYPARTQAIAMARKLGVDEQAIRDIQNATVSLDSSKNDGPVKAKVWLFHILQREMEMSTGLILRLPPRKD